MSLDHDYIKGSRTAALLAGMPVASTDSADLRKNCKSPYFSGSKCTHVFANKRIRIDRTCPMAKAAGKTDGVEARA